MSLKSKLCLGSEVGQEPGDLGALQAGAMQLLLLGLVDHHVVGEAPGADLPHVGHPVVVNPPLRVHVNPEVARSHGAVWKQSLGVREVDLYFPAT